MLNTLKSAECADEQSVGLLVVTVALVQDVLQEGFVAVRKTVHQFHQGPVQVGLQVWEQTAQLMEIYIVWSHSENDQSN